MPPDTGPRKRRLVSKSSLRAPPPASPGRIPVNASVARHDTAEAGLVAEILDPDWYQARYPDVAASNLAPLRHFIDHGAAEKRDPNRFFDSSWYIEHYPDVAASGLHPLMHYLRAGALERRNPHPRFDAAYYVDLHPDAADNPLLYHLRTGMARGYLTEAPIDIHDYLPSTLPPLPLPARIFADVIIPIETDFETSRRCIRSVMADRGLPLARIIIVDDNSPHPDLKLWLQELSAEGHIHLIQNRRHLGLAASAALGIKAAETHDVVLLNSDTEVPGGWLRRLTAQAYANPDIATVSPLGSADEDLTTFGGTRGQIDEVCRTVNPGRSAAIPYRQGHCLYIRRAVLGLEPFLTTGTPGKDFDAGVTAIGWQHRLACDTFVYKNIRPHAPNLARPVPASAKSRSAGTGPGTPSRFAITAALLRQSDLPVILMITHDFGGGVRRHIDSLVDRYRNSAHVLLLQATNRGAALSVPAVPNHPTLTLPSDRLDDLVTLLRSMNVCRIHIHHLLRMDMDIQTLTSRLAVPFDVTVHDYFAICPQINLLRWPEGLYCGEPGPAGCNACIADRSSHGARDIISWRRGWAWQFGDAQRVICPSADVKARLDRHGLAAHAIVAPHEQQSGGQWPCNLPNHPSPPLRIVLLGILANHKGARFVAEVAEAAPPGTIELHLVGQWESSFPAQAKRLIKATGEYQDRDLAAILRRINPHVFWFPSSAPESYSYTLSTAIATGLPIVATDFGSFKERLFSRPLTWLVDHRASAMDWLNTFETVQVTLREQAKQPPVPRPSIASDFYAVQYLAPILSRQHARSNQSEREIVAPLPVTRRGTGAPRIAIVPERHGNGGLTPCAYIRLLQPLDHLATGGGFDIVLANAETIFDYDVDIIATQRHAIADLSTANRLADHGQQTGAKLLFDLDDDLLNVPVTHPDAGRLRPLAKIVRRMLTIADCVWVSTPGLAERLVATRPDAQVMENRLDERIWTHTPGPTAFQDDPVRILCMGTSTHDRDFAMIEPGLLRLKSDYGDRVSIDILGMTSRNTIPVGLNRIGPPTHASRSYPGFVNWLTSTQPRWHIGLAPLLDTAFNRAKSPIKAMDYAAMGLAVVASDMPVYRGSIADGPAGQLAANDHQSWFATLDWLVRDQDFRRATAQRARQAFLARATLASHVAERRAALMDLLQAAQASACGATFPR